jgi:hypothetical protein
LILGYPTGDIQLWEVSADQLQLINHVEPKNVTITAPTSNAGAGVGVGAGAGAGAGAGTGPAKLPSMQKAHTAMGSDHCLMRAKTTKDFIVQAAYSKDIHQRTARLHTSSPWDTFDDDGGDEVGGDAGGKMSPGSSGSPSSVSDSAIQRSISLPSKLPSRTTSVMSFSSVVSETSAGAPAVEVMKPTSKLLNGAVPLDVDTLFEQFCLLAWSSTM